VSYVLAGGASIATLVIYLIISETVTQSQLRYNPIPSVQMIEISRYSSSSNILSCVKSRLNSPTR
jgi:hypothetical protein